MLIQIHQRERELKNFERKITNILFVKNVLSNSYGSNLTKWIFLVNREEIKDFVL